MKKLLKPLLAIIVLFVIIVVGGSFYMLSYSLLPSHNKGRNEAYMWKLMKHRCPGDSLWLDSLRASHALRDTFVIAADGDRHHAVYLWPNNRKKFNHKVAVLVHGYTDDYISMLPIAHIYYKMGYGIMLPDLHGNGRSDGEEQQMGWKDRNDVRQWIAVATDIFGCEKAEGKRMVPNIVVHGVSMGAATVMCLSGDPLPYNVRCFVEDCGYTSAWDEFSLQLKERFALPDFPLMYSTSALCRLRYGWSFGQASPIRQMAKCQRPMLLIHGDHDTFVPTAMVYELYKAKPAPKCLWVATDARHARSYDKHPGEYARRVSSFVNKYMH